MAVFKRTLYDNTAGLQTTPENESAPRTWTVLHHGVQPLSKHL